MLEDPSGLPFMPSWAAFLTLALLLAIGELVVPGCVFDLVRFCGALYRHSGTAGAYAALVGSAAGLRHCRRGGHTGGTPLLRGQ